MRGLLYSKANNAMIYKQSYQNNTIFPQPINTTALIAISLKYIINTRDFICRYCENDTIMLTSSLLSSKSFSTLLIACCFSPNHCTQANRQMHDLLLLFCLLRSHSFLSKSREYNYTFSLSSKMNFLH